MHILLRLSLFLVATLILIPSDAEAQNISYSRVRVMLEDPGTLGRLAALGIAVDHGELKSGSWFETDLSSTEIAVATANGFELEVMITDVTEHYRSRSATGLMTERSSSICQELEPLPLPANFSLGSMGGFFTWEEMLDQLDAMRTAYPQLISAPASIGESHEGRPIHLVRISNDPDNDQDKPELLYNSLHHAREPASLHQLITFMWYLLERYGSDAEVTYLVDNMELYFVPCVNPDGYVFNSDNYPDGGGMWRKNRRNNGDGTYGVDLNRNYGYEWGIDDEGSSPNTSSDVYRGPGPFSEPETQAMRDLCNARVFRHALNYHTYGNLLVYPWGFQPSYYTPDSAAFVNHAVELTEENRYRFGTDDQTVNYLTNGNSDDWMYGEQDTKPEILSMTPEAGFGGDGFWPSIDRIPNICQDNIRQNLRTAHLSGRFARLLYTGAPVLQGSDAHVRFSIQRLGVEPGPMTVSIEPLENVTGTGAPIEFADLAMLEERQDSIAISLDPALPDGSTFRFVLALNNGAYTYRDTITKISGQPLIIFADDGSNFSNWQNNGWGITTDAWTSAPSSITDSPFGNYTSNTNDVLTLQDPLDLTAATTATLTFRAKWDLEAYYDQVQVLGSTNGVTWTPLCGLYTRSGGQFQNEGEPVYDGQQPNWIREEISLNDLLGSPAWLRFRLETDQGGNHDGFHLDDIMVTITGEPSTAIMEEEALQFLHPQPNPADDHTWITYAFTGAGTAELMLFDAVGALVRSEPLANPRGSIRLDTADLRAGMYSFTVMVNGRTAGAKKLVVVR